MNKNCSFVKKIFLLQTDTQIDNPASVEQDNATDEEEGAILDRTHSGKVNFIYQMDVTDSRKNSVLACWISDNDINDMKSITLSKAKIKAVNDVLNDCSEWVLRASANRRWLNKQRYKTQKQRAKELMDQLSRPIEFTV